MSDIQTDDKAVAIEKGHKWSTSKFLIGIPKIIFNMSFISWAVYTVLFMGILKWVMGQSNGDLHTILSAVPIIIMTIGWVATTFVMAINLQKAISTMVENTKITAELKAIAQANVNTDTAKVIEAAKNITKG